MAKIIKYKFSSCDVNNSTEENPNVEQVVFDKEIYCATQAIFDENYLIAESEAVGEIIVEGEFDDEPTPEFTLENRVETLETDSTEMKEALEMILSGVTE